MHNLYGFLTKDVPNNVREDFCYWGDSGIACDAKLTINNAQCTIGMVSLQKVFRWAEGLHLRRRSFDAAFGLAQDDNVDAASHSLHKSLILPAKDAALCRMWSEDRFTVFSYKNRTTDNSAGDPVPYDYSSFSILSIRSGMSCRYTRHHF